MSIAFAEFETFAAFRDAHKRHIRPDGTLPRLRRAFEIDVAFIESYALLRPFLARFQNHWAEVIVAHATQARSADGLLRAEDAEAFARLYRIHVETLVRGAFDEDWLDTLEDVALFMIYRDIKSVWLSGAHQKILAELVDVMFDRIEKHRRLRLQTVVKLVAKAVAIEMNQIQRVFTTLETHRLALLHAERWGEEAFALRLDAPFDPHASLPATTLATVREIADAVAPHGEALARKFFERLFELDPALKPAFPDAVEARRALFSDGLALGVARLDEIGRDAGEIAALARRLAAIGATPSRYEAIGQALLQVMASSVGRRWTPSVSAAWRDAYRALARSMIKAAADASSAGRAA